MSGSPFYAKLPTQSSGSSGASSGGSSSGNGYYTVGDGTESQMRAQYEADRGIVRGNEQAIRGALNPIYQQAQPTYYQPQIARNPATGFGNAPVDPRFLATVASLGQQDQTRFAGVNPMLQQAQQQYAAFGPYTQQVQQGIAGLQQVQRISDATARGAEKARLAKEARLAEEARQAEEARRNAQYYSGSA